MEGNRKYVKCLYVYNKIDTVCLEDVELFLILSYLGRSSCTSSLQYSMLNSNESECGNGVGVDLGIHGSTSNLYEEASRTSFI